MNTKFEAMEGGGVAALPARARVNFHITDRRLNPSGKNLSNRQRFLDRVRKGIEKSVAKGLKNRGVSDTGDAEISVPKDGIQEPHFDYNRDYGVWDYMLPGNKEYSVGDTIPRPRSGDGGGGSKGSTDEEGEDDFRFYVSYEEYLDAILGDLSLPDMIKTSERKVISWMFRRAGFTPVGPASNLALEKTMIQGISRRIALKTPKYVRLNELEALLAEEEDEDRKLELEAEIAELEERLNAIPFLDKVDLRFHNTVKQPLPITQAVMFCLMDVSGSMTEHMKDLAKRFYILLYVFLKKQYKDVEVVFIRHTHMASRVDEDTFFHSPETGGTVVSTALEEMIRVIRAEFPVDQWNIYAAQASDGDNTDSDGEKTQALLSENILPICQYMTYIEVGRDEGELPPGWVRRKTDLWESMEMVQAKHPQRLAMRKITNKSEIVEVFRSLFKKREVE